MIRAAARGRAREAEFDVARDVGRHACEIARKTRRGIGESRRAHVFHATGPIVLIEERLQSADDLGMIAHVAAGAVQALLLATPVAHENRAARIRIDLLQDPHRFHDHDRAGAVIGRA